MVKKKLKSYKKKVNKVSKNNKLSIKSFFSGESIVSSSKEARDLYSQSVFGEYINEKIHYSLVEALYLVDKGKISVYSKSKKLNFNELIERCNKIDNKILFKFLVYKDLRNRGYLLKTALKFGADFRVYDKGIRPGKDHSKWLLYCVNESSEMTWHDFSAKNRVAHSTNKNLLIAVVDSEGGITYYEIAWKRP
ncbi:MAG TPA: tRNA-intron lyase [Candidatus Paceibacterota bacterium]|nr:tRNA-intron lyase [Candidatus Paceibacterota bacterium]